MFIQIVAMFYRNSPHGQQDLWRKGKTDEREEDTNAPQWAWDFLSSRQAYNSLHIQAQGQTWGDLFPSHKSGKQEGGNGKRKKTLTWITVTTKRKRCALSTQDNRNRVSRKGERNPQWLPSPLSSSFYKSRIFFSRENLDLSLWLFM